MLTCYPHSDRIFNVLFLILICIFIIVFLHVDIQEKLLFSTVLLPLLLWIVFQEKLLWTSNNSLYKRMRVMFMLSTIFCLYFFLSQTNNWYVLGFNEVILHFSIFLILWTLFWNISTNESKYVPIINGEIVFIHWVIFFYWLWGISLFLIACVFLNVILLILYRTNSLFLEWLLSISYSIVWIIFWFGYMYYIFDKYIDVLSFQSVSISNLIVMAEFLVLGLSIGYILQSFLMISVYLPARDQFYWAKHRRIIRETNQQLLDRFHEGDFSRSTFFFSILLTISLVTLHNSTNFIPLQLFIGIVFILLSLSNLFVFHLMKK